MISLTAFHKIPEGIPSENPSGPQEALKNTYMRMLVKNENYGNMCIDTTNTRAVRYYSNTYVGTNNMHVDIFHTTSVCW